MTSLLKYGNQDAEAAVLIALVVNVETLVLQTFVEDLKAGERVGPDLALTTFAHLTAHGGFAQLQHLHLKHQEGYSRPYMMDVRAHIARLHHRTLDKLIIEDGFTPGENWFEQDAGSAPKLRSLDLANCKVQARATARAICSFTGLKELIFSCIEYYYRGGLEGWGQVFDVLPTHAATLENLRVMAYEPISQPKHFNWNEMVALRSLTVPSDLLLFRSPDTLLEEDPLLHVEGESLAGLLALPPSLEALYVTTTHHLHDLRSMLVTILPAITDSMHTLELHFVDEEDTRDAVGNFQGEDSLELDGIRLSISSETIKFAYRGSDWNTVSKYCARAQEMNSVFEPFSEVGESCVGPET
ncbi:hypothetical protein B0A48_04957 [Cryoendolithus antarcticus]|uniref:F-box domain-containing protein n=1 Tax=Cryoendolithus antarcticus TaxID=1507870 RepID=A0A1V8TDU9_9PEZI|nr:hypothetical protein B0A48_04957 [Cryoendolithus antarcticus]